MSKSIPAEPVSGETMLIPLTKLKKSPRNARTTPHPAPDIEALAASIAAKGMLQNLVVEPERDPKGRATGIYLVTIGEGRRLAHKILAKRNDIAKDVALRCVVDTEHNSREISLAENVLRSPMHPADQYEAFAALQREQGMSAEDIAARFGVTAAVVRQRLKLAAVSPTLIARYRAGELDLDALTAFTITDDHVLQERVWNSLPEWDRQRQTILHALTETQVAVSDRRAVFVGAEAYEAAGGIIIRDLFDEEGGGYFADADLLNRMVHEKLQRVADQVRAEGWQWVSVEATHDYASRAGMRRVYPVPVELSPQQQEQLEALEAEYNAFCDTEEEITEANEGEFARLERELESCRRVETYAPEVLATAGAIVSLGHAGEARIERGFVQKEDETADETADRAQREPASSIPGKLVAELTSYRTAALRNELAQRPAIALVAVTHALAASCFYRCCSAQSCLGLAVRNAPLTPHAPAINENVAMLEIDTRHECWARRLPPEPEQLWDAIAALDEPQCLALLAHCVGVAVDAVQAPHDRADAPRLIHADQLARAVALDMTRYWQPTVERYLGRVAKPRIAEAIREAVSSEAAENLATMKKAAMAEVAAERLAGTGWLPPILRAPSASVPSLAELPQAAE